MEFLICFLPGTLLATVGVVVGVSGAGACLCMNAVVGEGRGLTRGWRNWGHHFSVSTLI